MKVIYPSKKEADMLRELGITGQSAVVIVMPEAVEALRDKGIGKDKIEETLEDYDFGGEADVQMDIVSSLDHYSLSSIFDPDEMSVA